MQQDPATIDPFLSVPSYGQKFEPQVRELPRLGELRAARSVFPRELRGLLPGGTGILEKDAKRRIVAPPPSAVQRQRASQLAVAVATGELGGNAAAATVAAVAVDEDGGEEEEGKRREEGDIDLEEVDEVYDDEDAGDYDAEQYFETGEASEEEFGGGGEDGGDYF